MGYSRLRCVVEGCQGRGGHIFPTNPERKAAWLKAIKWSDPENDPPPPALVCHQHFLETDYKNNQVDLQTFAECGTLGKNRRLRLRKTAVPSVLLGESSRTQQIVTEQDGELLIEITDRREDIRVSSDTEDECETIIVVGDSEEATGEDDVLTIEEDAVSFEYPRDEPPPDGNYDYETDDDSYNDTFFSNTAESIRNNLNGQDSSVCLKTALGELVFNNSILTYDKCMEEEEHVDCGTLSIEEFMCDDDGHFQFQSESRLPVNYNCERVPTNGLSDRDPESEAEAIFSEGEHIENDSPDMRKEGVEIVDDEELDHHAQSVNDFISKAFKMTKKLVSVQPNELKGEPDLALPKITLMRKGKTWCVEKNRARCKQKGNNIVSHKISKKPANSLAGKQKGKFRNVKAIQRNEIQVNSTTHKRKGKVGKVKSVGRIGSRQRQELKKSEQSCDVSSQNEDLPDLSPLPEPPSTVPECACIDVSDDDSYSSVEDLANDRLSPEAFSDSVKDTHRNDNNNLSFNQDLTHTAEIPPSRSPLMPGLSTFSIQHRILQQVAMKVSNSSVKKWILEKLANSERADSSVSQQEVQAVPSTPAAAQSNSPAAAPSNSPAADPSNAPAEVAPSNSPAAVASPSRPSVVAVSSSSDETGSNPELPTEPSSSKVSKPSASKTARPKMNKSVFSGSNSVKNPTKPTIKIAAKKTIKIVTPEPKISSIMKTTFSSSKSLTSIKPSKKINILKPKKKVSTAPKIDAGDPVMNVPLLNKAYEKGSPLVVKWNKDIPKAAQYLGASGDKTFYMLEDVAYPKTKKPLQEVPKSPPREIIRKLVQEWGESDDDEDYQMFVIPAENKTNLPVAAAPATTAAAAPTPPPPLLLDEAVSASFSDEDCTIIENPPETINLCDDDDDDSEEGYFDDDTGSSSEYIEPIEDDDVLTREVENSYRDKDFGVSRPRQYTAGVAADVKIVVPQANSAARNLVLPTESSKVPTPICRTSTRRPHDELEDPTFISEPYSVVENNGLRSAVLISQDGKLIVSGNTLVVAVEKPTVQRASVQDFSPSQTARKVAESSIAHVPPPKQSSLIAPSSLYHRSEELDGFLAPLPPTPATSPSSLSGAQEMSPIAEITTDIPEDLFDELLAETNDEITISPDGDVIASGVSTVASDGATAEHVDAPTLPRADSAAATPAASMPVLYPENEEPVQCGATTYEYPTKKESPTAERPDAATSADAEQQPPSRGTPNANEASGLDMALDSESKFQQSDEATTILSGLHRLLESTVAQPAAEPIASADLYVLANVAADQVQSTQGSLGMNTDAHAGPPTMAEILEVAKAAIQTASIPETSVAHDVMDIGDPISNGQAELARPTIETLPIASYQHINMDHCYFMPFSPNESRNHPHRILEAEDTHLKEQSIKHVKRRKCSVRLKRLTPEELARYTRPSSPEALSRHFELEEASDDECDFSEAMAQTCYHCDQDLPCLKALRKHISFKHKYNQLICPHCFAGFLCPVKCNEHIWDAHKQIGSGVTYACTQCDFTTNDHCTLRGHIDVAHKVQQRHKTCSECIFKCTSDAAMADHMNKYHSTKSHSGYIVSNIQDMIGEEIIPLPIGVPVLNQNPIELIGTGECAPSIDSELTALPNQTADDTVKVPCPECTWVFPNLTELGKHIVAVHEMHDCIVCRRPFQTATALKTHMRSHTVPKCPICQLQLPGKPHLIKHVLDVHPNESTWCRWCRFCPFATMFELALKLHCIAVHKTFSFPVKCPVCALSSTRNFLNVKDLLAHTARVHHEVHNQVVRI